MRTSRRTLVWSSVALFVLSARPAVAQPPPAHGTVALEGTMKTFYRAANTIIVTTIDGVEHVYHFTKDLVVHGGKGSGVDALEGLRAGTTVVVHYAEAGGEASALEIDRIGDEGLKITEGVVTRIDRGRKQIVVRFENGKSDTFRLTERAVQEAAQDTGTSKVIIYYSDETGRKVAHYFRKTS